MPTHSPADEAAIREQAYYFWEQDGRPAGRETEYWMRATIAVSEKTQIDRLTKAPPKKAARPAAVKPKTAKPKAVATTFKAAASKAKAGPSKTAKPDGKAKPKKK